MFFATWEPLVPGADTNSHTNGCPVQAQNGVVKKGGNEEFHNHSAYTKENRLQEKVNCLVNMT